ncbi:dihydrofolate reductase [Terrihabitans sp. B22-R8]|uniref:dihydrofolate reductase n=1 Tax=Terrihabitans sp. B22-R8 TaxID=3425128 RepID=UPI00403C2C45
MKEPVIVLVAAMAKNRVIGNEGKMPWHVPSDLKRFRAVTWGKPMIMGRKTWESIGRALPGRESVVVTSVQDYAAEGAHVVHSLEAGLERARQLAVELRADEIAVVGGGEIFAQMLDSAQRIHLTEIDCLPEGDAFFPDLDPGQWVEESRAPHDAGHNDECSFAFVEYVPKAASDVT